MGNDALTLKDYLPLISVVIGGLLVAIGGFASNTWLEIARERKSRRTLALALQGEIQALLEIFEKRGYIEGIRAAKAQTEATGKFQAYHFRARKNYFSVFEAHVGQVGILRLPLSELVTRFYAQANSILEDMERFEKLDPASVDPLAAIADYDEVLSLFEDTVAIGKQIVQLVSRRYARVPF
ncbi:MAG: hypothetical protein KKH12_12585 [Gammaproteobacteria bacterium]|nr:hypothetical protein [Gammaproteobacteria bacterium]MBU1482492.1 hypothetical protein [Gammaproteobacteria bacterium]